MSTHIVDTYTDVDKIQQLYKQREDVMADPQFQLWYKQFNVGRLHTNRELVHNANNLMKQWSGVDTNNNILTRFLRRLHAM
jgi:hypothetical protein